MRRFEPQYAPPLRLNSALSNSLTHSWLDQSTSSEHRTMITSRIMGDVFGDHLREIGSHPPPNVQTLVRIQTRPPCRKAYLDDLGNVDTHGAADSLPPQAMRPRGLVGEGGSPKRLEFDDELLWRASNATNQVFVSLLGVPTCQWSSPNGTVQDSGSSFARKHRRP